MNNVDNIRLEQFRQIKKEIRGSQEYLIAGIDIAKSKNYVFFGDTRGKTLLKRMIFENNLAGFNKLRAYEDSLKVRSHFPYEISFCFTLGVKTYFYINF